MLRIDGQSRALVPLPATAMAQRRAAAPQHRWRVALSAAASLLVVTATAMPVSSAAGAVPPKLDPAVLSSASPRAIVLFDHDVGDPTIERLAGAGITHARVFDTIDAVAVLGPHSAYMEVASWEDVVWVDDDSRVFFQNHVAKVDSKVTRVRRGSKPLDASYTGKGVTVAVVDSGVDTTHPDLMERVAANVNMEPSPQLDLITDGAYSEQHSEGPLGTDEYGHGTHVAGIVGGSGEMDRGADLSGVAPEATLINCKMGLSTAFETSVLACYQWILDHRNDSRFPGGIRVATNSWGLQQEPKGRRPLELMMKQAVKRDITVLFSAGNEGKGRNGESTVLPYPNDMENVITVGATCKSKGSNEAYCEPLEVASFSSRGPEVDVTAPGVDIWSARATVSFLHVWGVATGSNEIPGSPNPLAIANNRALYIGISGTSMSTPHVAGIVALMLEANPRLTPRRVERILTSTARDFGPKGFDPDYGYGFVDALRAVAAAERS